jgi:protein-tyrosine phosphatase
MTGYLRILTVCSFNRVRSVAMAGHLRTQLRTRHTDAHVVGAGFGPPGEPPLPEVTAALAHVGIDVAGYRSRTVDRPTVAGADLIVTAERLHVVRLSEDDGEVFARTFTLPELVTLGEAVGPRGGAPLDEWLRAVGSDRTPASFLASNVQEIADPTGLAAVTVAAAVADIGDWCRRLAVLL